MQTNKEELQAKLKTAEEALLAEIATTIHRPAEMKKLREKLVVAEETIEELRFDIQDLKDRNNW